MNFAMSIVLSRVGAPMSAPRPCGRICRSDELARSARTAATHISRRTFLWLASSWWRPTTSTPRSPSRGNCRRPGPAVRSRCGLSVKCCSMALDGVFRDHWARVLATLIGILGDVELAEDAAQEAFAIAAERWPLPLLPFGPRRTAPSRRARRRGAPRLPARTRTRPDGRRAPVAERPAHPARLRLRGARPAFHHLRRRARAKFSE
jgi:hypothetical protein